MFYNYVNFIYIFYDKELQEINFPKLHAFILIHCGLFYSTKYITFQYILHILTFPPKPSYSIRIIWFIREYVYTILFLKLLTNFNDLKLLNEFHIYEYYYY